MESSLLQFLVALKAEGVANNIPNISYYTGSILQFFAEITGAKRFFEIGCANGFSTIFLAAAAKKNNGRVVTCDRSKPSFIEAKKNMQKARLQEYVEFRFGNAQDVLQPHERFDFIFIDGQKNKTHEFFLLAKKHLHPRGIIIIDDTKKFPQKMRKFQKLRAQEQEYLFCDIPVDGDDSITLIFHRKAR